MKYLFTIILLILIAVSLGVYWTAPDTRSDVPIIYWVTDPNPARGEQINKFHAWLVKNGHTKPGDPTRPKVELRLDTANRDISKQIIQCVSGVGGDIMDVGSTGGTQLFFDEMGIIHDVTEDAKRLGFDPGYTYPAMESEITVPGRDGKRKQVMFPCNVAVIMLWVNKATFRKYGFDVPPKRMTFEQFERIGKQFVDKANPKKKRFQDVFFVNSVDPRVMYRSLGLSAFNETLTRCTLNDPRYIRVLRLYYKWMYKDRIIPSPSDASAFSTEAGYGGSAMQLFNNGNYAMYRSGRYALIQLREFGQMELAVCEHPHGGFPNTSTGTRGAAVYRGTKHKKLAMLFLSFLASEDYNMQVVDDGDALPPNPKYTEIEEFKRPKKYPNEWGCHEAFSTAIGEIAIGLSLSPFVAPSTVTRLTKGALGKFMSDKATAENVAEEAQRRVNEEIDRRLKEDPSLKPRYDTLVKLQKKIDALVSVRKQIDALKSDGKNVPKSLADQAEKIPLEWIENIFYRRYYKAKGWAE